ncbi:MAG: septum formation initiator family protein [bacterium]
MKNFQQKKQFHKIIYSKLSIIILLILIIFLIKPTYNIYKKSKLSSDNYNEIKKNYENLENRKNMLESGINKLKTDNGIEEEIRSKFNVAKSGETVIKIINSSSSVSTSTNKQKNFWEKLINRF